MSRPEISLPVFDKADIFTNADLRTKAEDTGNCFLTNFVASVSKRKFVKKDQGTGSDVLAL